MHAVNKPEEQNMKQVKEGRKRSRSSWNIAKNFASASARLCSCENFFVFSKWISFIAFVGQYNDCRFPED